MDFLTLAAQRYSMRKFDARQVASEDLEKILEAGRLAPTAVNYQPQRILVLQSPEGLAKVAECTRYHFHAPTILLVCYDTGASWKNGLADQLDAGPEDAAIVITQMMLQATELGLGTTFVGAFDPKKAIEVFQLPDYLKPVAFLPLGYPTEETKPAYLHALRKPLAETVFHETFEGLVPEVRADKKV